MQCVQSQLADANSVFLLEDAMLVAETSNLGFACTLYVKCRHGNHGFTVEPQHVPFKETEIENDSPPTVGTNITAGMSQPVADKTNNTMMEPDKAIVVVVDSNDASMHKNVETSSITSKITIGNDHDTCNESPPIKKWGRPLKTHKTEDYTINYQAYLMMQLFGNGISGIDTMLGMLGIAVHSGSHSSWDAIANQLGVAQQKVASAVQESNLLNKIEEMKKGYTAS